MFGFWVIESTTVTGEIGTCMHISHFSMDFSDPFPPFFPLLSLLLLSNSIGY